MEQEQRSLIHLPYFNVIHLTYFIMMSLVMLGYVQNAIRSNGRHSGVVIRWVKCYLGYVVSSYAVRFCIMPCNEMTTVDRAT